MTKAHLFPLRVLLAGRLSSKLQIENPAREHRPHSPHFPVALSTTLICSPTPFPHLPKTQTATYHTPKFPFRTDQYLHNDSDGITMYSQCSS